MLIGKRISKRYKILDVIGGGGMSNVYLAHDMILNRDVAMKILHYNFNDQDESYRRFQREALSATSLNHPNIVSIYDVGEDEGLHYLVMEYVKGMTLKQYITEYAPLAPTRCVEIMQQLTSAIAVAHQNQIIHRDIKPQNILLDEEGNVKVTDFGIAMALTATSFTKTNSVLGTVHYLSPEQARGGMTTKKSDIYSLGIVLYELLTGELPFSGESAVSIALKHLQAETPSVRAIVPTIPQSLENVVLKATAKDARHRYFTVEKMRDDLETVLIEERANEPRFVIPEDHDATKAMPIIKDRNISNEDEQRTKIMPSNSERELPKKKKKKRKRKGLWITLFTMIFILIAAIIIWLNPAIIEGKKITVPNVENRSLDVAIDELQAAGFTIGTQEIKNSEDIKEGNVVGTDPEAGTQRKKGTEIDIIVSKGKETSAMIDYAGKNIEQAKSLLSKRGFKKVSVKKEYSNKPVDTIIGQSPKANKQIIPAETNVTLTISQGEKLNIVSNLVGFDENALKTYADSSGFNIKITDEEYSSEVAVGKVSSQSIESGTTLKVGSTIDVILSKGPKEKAVKPYSKVLKLEFDPKENAEGEVANYQTVKIYIQDKTHSIGEVNQEFRIYDDVEKPIKLQVEEDSEASYKVFIDGEVVYDEKISFDEV